MGGLVDAAFSTDGPALATTLEGGGLVLFDLVEPDASAAAAPDLIGIVTTHYRGAANSLCIEPNATSKHAGEHVEKRFGLPPRSDAVEQPRSMSFRMCWEDMLWSHKFVW